MKPYNISPHAGGRYIEEPRWDKDFEIIENLLLWFFRTVRKLKAVVRRMKVRMDEIRIEK